MGALEMEQSAKDVRLQQIEQRMRQLSAKKDKLFQEAVGFSIPTVEINAVCAEYARLDLERYELERG